MARESKFETLRKQAWRLAKTLSDGVTTGPLPVPIMQLAFSRNIRRIRIEPILSTAGLVKASDGYEIWVNTEAPGVKESEGHVFELPGDCCQELDPPLRYSIAHEVAHTIFAEVLGGSRNEDFLRKHERALEAVCSEIARTLLLPKSRLLAEIGGRLFDASHLDAVRRSFRVSPEVFVLRFQLADVRVELQGVDGFVGYAVENYPYLVFRMLQTIGPQGSSRFGVRTDHGRDRSGTTRGDVEQTLSLPGIVSRIRQDQAYKEDVRVPCRDSTVLPCTLSARHVCDRPLSVIVALEILGPPERTARTLF
jgi:hypothetical protein